MEETIRKRRLLIILYVGFISLGLPDTVLGVAWPEMRLDFTAPWEWAGWLLTLTTVISVMSSLAAGAVMKRFHAGLILTASAFMTSAAMLGYSLAPSVTIVAIFTLLFGIGQGAVDSAVNAHMSKHYSSRHMNWVHGCWGLGATSGPLIFTALFTSGASWRTGYFSLFIIQASLGLLFLCTLKLWRAPNNQKESAKRDDAPFAPSLDSARWNAVKAAAGVCFYFLYPGLEVIAGLWGALYLVEILKAPASTAGAAMALYWGSLTLGRFAIGFIAGRHSNQTIIRGGLGLVAIALTMCLTISGSASFTVALGLMGLGLAPLYPTMMHQTPWRVGLERSDMVISFQVGAALAGAAVLPVAVGMALRQAWSLASLPKVLAFFAVCLIIAHEISANQKSTNM